MQESKHDIQTRDDLGKLVSEFYNKAIPDPVIGHFFTQVVELDFSTHIPKIADFWSGILLGDRSYRGNPMEAHIHMNQKSTMEQKHFDRWVELWIATVDEYFSGPKAEEAKLRAQSIAQLMHLKVQQ